MNYFVSIFLTFYLRFCICSRQYNSILNSISASKVITESTFLRIKENCDVLRMNDWEILRKIQEYDKKTGLEYVITISCPDDDDIFMKAFSLALEEREYPALKAIINNAYNYEETRARRLVQHIFASCAKAKDQFCLSGFKNKICRIRDQAGRTILHLAAIEDSIELFEYAKDCISLMGRKDFQGKYALECVKSAEMAEEMNRRWLEQARNNFLPIETARIRLDICHQFSVECAGDFADPSELPRGVLLKDLYNVGIDNVEDFYCPFLKMKINLRALKGQDSSGIFLEWMTVILDEIFGSSKSEDAENFEAPFFRKDEILQVFVPTGFYDAKVYQFIGKFVAVANYFSLRLNDFVRQGSDAKKLEYFKAFDEGLKSLNLIRLETHYLGKEPFFVMKGKNILVPIKVINESYKRAHYDDERSVITAIDSLSGENKMRLIKLFGDRENNSEFSLNKSINVRMMHLSRVEDGFKINRSWRMIDMDSRNAPENYKLIFERILQNQ